MKLQDGSFYDREWNAGISINIHVHNNRIDILGSSPSKTHLKKKLKKRNFKGELRRKMIWSNKTLVPSQPFWDLFSW